MGTASFPASIFTAWSDENLYVAFRLAESWATDLRSTHTSWITNPAEPGVKTSAKSLSNPFTSTTRSDPSCMSSANPAAPGSNANSPAPKNRGKPFEGAAVRYASSVDPAAQIWRAEIAIPWKAINSAGHGRPSLLRFNFSQHQNATGESASWAGPIDFRPG